MGLLATLGENRIAQPTQMLTHSFLAGAQRSATSSPACTLNTSLCSRRTCSQVSIVPCRGAISRWVSLAGTSRGHIRVKPNVQERSLVVGNIAEGEDDWRDCEALRELYRSSAEITGMLNEACPMLALKCLDELKVRPPAAALSARMPLSAGLTHCFLCCADSVQRGQGWVLSVPLRHRRDDRPPPDHRALPERRVEAGRWGRASRVPLPLRIGGRCTVERSDGLILLTHSTASHPSVACVAACCEFVVHRLRGQQVSPTPSAAQVTHSISLVGRPFPSRPLHGLDEETRNTLNFLLDHTNRRVLVRRLGACGDCPHGLRRRKSCTRTSGRSRSKRASASVPRWKTRLSYTGRRS
jgi:hypothetical protein